MSSVWGGIEAGGSHFVCAVGAGPDDLRAESRFSTTTPDKTILRALSDEALIRAEGVICDSQSVQFESSRR